MAPGGRDPRRWSAGAVVDVAAAGLALLQAFLAGAIILTVFKEELPAERQSNVPAFLAGLAIYAVVLVAAA